MSVSAQAKKNCHSCRHLEWVEGDDEASTGYDCNKRHEQMYQMGKEAELLANLSRESYLDRYKSCFEAMEGK